MSENEESTQKLTLNVRLLPAVVAIGLILYLLAPSRIWLVFLSGLGGAWLLAYLWVRSLRRGLTLQRSTRQGWARVGDQLLESFTLDNAGIAPGLWVEVVDHSTLPDRAADWVATVGSRDNNHWRRIRRCTRRGMFTLGPTTLRTGDPLGIYTLEIHDPSTSTLTVTPPIVPLPRLEIASGGRFGDNQPRRHALARMVSDTGVRQYLPGDSTQRIHWPTSARQGELYVRKMEGATTMDWWIYLDLDARVQAGLDENSTLELGVILAASLANRGLQERRRVGLVMVDKHLTRLAPASGDSQRWRILHALAGAEPGEVSLEHLLNIGKDQPRDLSSLIFITPSANTHWLTAMMPLLRRGASATAILIDPASFGAEASLTGLVGSLARQGVSHSIFDQGWLNRATADAESQRWSDSPSGGIRWRLHHFQKRRSSWPKLES